MSLTAILAGISYLHKDLEPDADSADVFGVGFAGNDPTLQATLRSLMDVNDHVQFDLSTRYVAELPNPHVPAYVAVDARLGYRVSDHLELSLSGSNLFDDEHVEFINPSLPVRPVSRTVSLGLRWRS